MCVRGAKRLDGPPPRLFALPVLLAGASGVQWRHLLSWCHREPGQIFKDMRESVIFWGVTEVTSLYQTWRFLGLGQTMNIYVKQK